MIARSLRTALALALTIGGGVAVACTKVGTDPAVPVAIELRPPPLPSIVVGDSLRDSTGAVAPLVAIAYNAQGAVIDGAPTRFLALDSLHRIGLDTVSGRVAGLDTGSVLVVASVGALQSAPDTLVVVDTPTTFRGTSPLVDSVTYTLSPRDTVIPLAVELKHVNGADSVAIRRFVVRYVFEYPAGFTNSDTTKVQLVDDARRPSVVDTTDATGAAVRSFRIAPFTHPATDSVIVRAEAVLPSGSPVAGSPVRFVVHYTIQ